MRRLCFIVVFTFFVIPSFDYAQTKSKPNLIAELILPSCSEYIRANLDSFFVELINNPIQKGYVLLNGKDGFEGQILTFKKIIFNHSKLRNFDSNSFEVIRGQNQKYGRVQFWSVSQNSDFRNSIKELVDKYKVPKNRLKIIYGKKQEESEIELWFVPNGDKPPKPTN